MITHYAFVDESGTESPFAGSRFLVVAAVSVINERDLVSVVKHIYKKYGSGVQTGELKAATSPPQVRMSLLSAVASIPVEIVAVGVDKRRILRPPPDPADLYRICVARAVRHAVALSPNIEICLDRRYSVARLRDRLEQTIRSAIADLPEAQVVLRQEDSVSRKGLQAADFVAWAFFQKCERDQPDYWRVLESRIVVEELVDRELW
jgi:hypothetical protein